MEEIELTENQKQILADFLKSDNLDFETYLKALNSKNFDEMLKDKKYRDSFKYMFSFKKDHKKNQHYVQQYYLKQFANKE